MPWPQGAAASLPDRQIPGRAGLTPTRQRPQEQSPPHAHIALQRGQWGFWPPSVTGGTPPPQELHGSQAAAPTF